MTIEDLYCLIQEHLDNGGEKTDMVVLEIAAKDYPETTSPCNAIHGMVGKLILIGLHII